MEQAKRDLAKQEKNWPRPNKPYVEMNKRSLTKLASASVTIIHAKMLIIPMARNEGDG